MSIRWLSLSKVHNGFVFSQTHSIQGPQWPYITEAVAHEFDCDPDDLDCHEDAEGREFVALHGEPIVEIHHCYMMKYEGRVNDRRKAKDR